MLLLVLGVSRWGYRSVHSVTTTIGHPGYYAAACVSWIWSTGQTLRAQGWSRAQGMLRDGKGGEGGEGKTGHETQSNSTIASCIDISLFFFATHTHTHTQARAHTHTHLTDCPWPHGPGTLMSRIRYLSFVMVLFGMVFVISHTHAQGK